MIVDLLYLALTLITFIGIAWVVQLIDRRNGTSTPSSVDLEPHRGSDV